MKASNPSGVVLYRGPSLLDGKPIVAILSLSKSSNEKTGDMVQTWILADNGESPLKNAQNGNDSSVCGDCIHRGKNGKLGSCYVNLVWAPNQIYKSYLAGNYPNYDPKLHNKRIIGRTLRYGAYGDPAAIPYEVWEKLHKLSSNSTGYTHAWKNCDQRLKKFLMASADVKEDVILANSKGWRTFRVRLPEDKLLENEIICPASKEAGKTRTCVDCKACHGAGNGKAKNIAIILHGWKYKTNRYRESIAEINNRKLIPLDLAA